MIRSILFALAFALAVPLDVHAHDLGTYGATFDIAETDLLKALGAKLQAAQASGRIDALNRRFAAVAEAHIENPAAVVRVSHTKRSRTWLYDPTIVVPQDLADASGRIFARAGDRINPLDRLPNYNRELVFFDGTDPAEVRFAVREARAKGPDRVLLILTRGAPVRLMKTEHLPLYFDQQGLLVRKLGITQVPAVVARAGRSLRIQEVLP